MVDGNEFIQRIFLYSYIQMRFTSKRCMDKDQTTTPGTPCPTLYDECVASLTSPDCSHYSVKQETGPTVYRPYPRRLEYLTRVSAFLLLSRVCGFITHLSSFQATFDNSTILHHLDIDHVGTQSSSASCAMLMRPNKAETAVHGCWLLSSAFISLVATVFLPFDQFRLSADDCGFNFVLISSATIFGNLSLPWFFCH